MHAGRARMTVDGRTGAESAEHRSRVRRCGANAGAGQRLADRAEDQAAHQAGIAEADIGLGRVDVYVDQCRIERDEQRGDRVPVARQNIGEGAANGAGDQPVAHRPAVDVDILLQRIGPRIGRD